MADDTELKALFRICAQLQKEINDLKSDGDEHYIAIEDLAKKIDDLGTMMKAIFNLLAK